MRKVVTVMAKRSGKMKTGTHVTEEVELPSDSSKPY